MQVITSTHPEDASSVRVHRYAQKVAGKSRMLARDAHGIPSCVYCFSHEYDTASRIRKYLKHASIIHLTYVILVWKPPAKVARGSCARKGHASVATHDSFVALPSNRKVVNMKSAQILTLSIRTHALIHIQGLG